MKTPPDATPTLESRRLSDRAEAVRTLGTSGGPQDLEPLLALAQGDKSSGVRLAAAAAMADILARCRLPGAIEPVPESICPSILERLVGKDPGQNTGLFQVIAELGLPDGRRHLVRGLRDPRVDVRTGALIGLERLCRSPVAGDISDLETSIDALLGEPKLRPEVSVEVARLAARVGFSACVASMERLQDRLPEKWFEPLQEGIDLLQQEQRWWRAVATWFEAPESAARAGDRRWLVVLGDAWLWGGERELAYVPAHTADGRQWTVGFGDDEVTVACRLLRQGQQRHRAGQVLFVDSHVMLPMQEKDGVRLIARLLETDVVPSERRRELASTFGEFLSDKAPGQVSRALSLLWQGEATAAVERLNAVLASGKSAPEVSWHLACALRDLDSAAARVAARRYLEQASRRSPYLEQARLWLESNPDPSPDGCDKPPADEPGT